MSRKRQPPDRERAADSGAPAASLRLDKWLWFARVARTRAAAGELAASGHVRVNGQRAVSASRLVRPGDVLTIAVHRRVLVLKVVDTGERREAYQQARLLYEDLSETASDSGPEHKGGGLRG